jgi:glycosyltransferase involved in cell wall biosynthesis
MKITFVMGSGFGLYGGDRAIAMYAQRLQQRGHEVFLISRPPAKPTLRSQIKSVIKGTGWSRPPKNTPSHFDQLDIPRQLLESYRPVTAADLPDADVIIATWWETGKWVNEMPPAKGVKVYFLQHYEAFDYFPKHLVDETWQMPLHKIVVAQWLRDLAQDRFGDNHATWVPYGIDSAQFQVPPRSKQSMPTVGMMYDPTYWKGCDISLQAVAIAAQQIPNLRLVAFGRDEPLPELPLPANAVYSRNPSQDQIRDRYAQCDAWLFGSRSEGFGMPIQEAMCCRTPVIGTPAGAAPEYLSDGAGLLVNNSDPEDMARAIIQICHMSNEDWINMSNAAYGKVADYTWEEAVERFEAALLEAIARSPQQPTATAAAHTSRIQVGDF